MTRYNETLNILRNRFEEDGEVVSFSNQHTHLEITFDDGYTMNVPICSGTE